MENIDFFSLQCVGKAIKQLDEFRVSEKNLGTKTNVKRVDSARVDLLNVLFSNGYELQIYTYKLVKSQAKRPLVKK